MIQDLGKHPERLTDDENIRKGRRRSSKRLNKVCTNNRFPALVINSEGKVIIWSWAIENLTGKSNSCMEKRRKENSKKPGCSKIFIKRNLRLG
jgi:hypothetical protein